MKKVILVFVGIAVAGIYSTPREQREGLGRRSASGKCGSVGGV